MLRVPYSIVYGISILACFFYVFLFTVHYIHSCFLHNLTVASFGVPVLFCKVVYLCTVLKTSLQIFFESEWNLLGFHQFQLKTLNVLLGKYVNPKVLNG